MKPVKKPDGKWWVVDGDKVIEGPFDTEGEAWDWIEDNKPKPPTGPKMI